MTGIIVITPKKATTAIRISTLKLGVLVAAAGALTNLLPWLEVMPGQQKLWWFAGLILALKALLKAFEVLYLAPKPTPGTPIAPP